MWILVLLIAALVFGICYLVDKGFAKLFRSQAQHMSGLSVRLNKKYGAFGLILFALGVAAIFAGMNASLVLLIGGIIVVLFGVCLVTYYMTFGLFYDDESFLLTTFGKKSKAYRYEQIKCQQLYQTAAQIVIELQMDDDRTVQLQSSMPDVYPFLDKAFAAWCRQKGIAQEDCAFHDPANSCWFPPVEEA